MANMRIDKYDYRKLFIWNNRFQKVIYTNTTGSEVVLPKGRLMGRITSSQKAWPHVSTATDGSEQPVFVLADDYVVANAATVTLTVCDGGDVDEALLVLGGSDNLDTALARTLTDSGSATVSVPYGSIRDVIARNTTLRLIKSTELTGYDNE